VRLPVHPGHALAGRNVRDVDGRLWLLRLELLGGVALRLAPRDDLC
jgi:hypothetical protein